MTIQTPAMTADNDIIELNHLLVRMLSESLWLN